MPLNYRKLKLKIKTKTPLEIMHTLRLLARWPSSRPKDGQFSEMGDFRRPVLGGHLRTSVLNVTKQCL